MKIVVLTPHFAPDTAPTGAVITRIVEELAARGHTIEVVTSLPWYREHRLEEGYEGKIVRREDTAWGQIVRVHPFPTEDKRNIPRRALSFAGFSAVAGMVGRKGDDVDIVLAVSPPLTLGVDGWLIARARKGRFVFNIQDVYPDVAVKLGVLNNKALIAAAHRLETFCYQRADAVTVLSDDLRDNLSRKTSHPERIHVIPNFVDTAWIRPMERENGYRSEFGLTGKTVVMYAGNVGMSQSLDLVIHAAGALSHLEDLVFVINGQGAARDQLERDARGLDNVVFVDTQPFERLPELLAAGDIHLVPLKKGLASSSVPSKTYSILAAGRPLIASVDPGTEIARLVERSGSGLAVPPEDPEIFTKAVQKLVEAPDDAAAMGAAGRAWVENWASPQAVAEAYEELFQQLLAAR
ncbi:MAG: glycosyltransferase family 4 protein [Actinomycetota bacterium]